MHPAHPLRADRTTGRWLLGLLSLALVVSLLPIGGAAADEHEAGEGPEPITVMTRNLYLGASLAPALTATDLAGAIAGATEIWAEVLATDYPERAGALADEILAADPHLIGLQEVSLWETGPFLAEPDTLELEFLDILLAELAARDLDYEAVSITEAFSSGLPGQTPDGEMRQFNLTDRDVILARSDVEVLDDDDGVFETSLALNIAGIDLPVVRGWNSADVEVDGQRFRFVNTHLEAFDENEAIRIGQAQELIDGPLDTDQPVVLLGDLNSNANADGEAYQLVLDAGFDDAWLLVNPEEEGLTCCHASDLRNEEVDLTSRIDLVLVRDVEQVLAAEVIGIDPELRTASGLWPSDHAGVVAEVVVGSGAEPTDPEEPETPTVPVFTDVDPDSVHAPAIAALVGAGITTGITEDTFGPSLIVRRDQMASFLARALELPVDPDVVPEFTDVDPNSVHAPAIAALVEAEITTGITADTYGPSQQVRRDQMATFLTRGFELDVPAEIDLPFVDVPEDSVHRASIAALVEAGITAGTSPTEFSPQAGVRRDQMATFLARALGLVPLPG